MTEALPDGMSGEEREQRDFFVGLLGPEIFKRILEPDFDPKAREIVVNQRNGTLFEPNTLV